MFLHYKIKQKTSQNRAKIPLILTSEGLKYLPEVRIQPETCSTICGTHVQVILNQKNLTGIGRGGQGRSKFGHHHCRTSFLMIGSPQSSLHFLMFALPPQLSFPRNSIDQSCPALPLPDCHLSNLLLAAILIFSCTPLGSHFSDAKLATHSAPVTKQLIRAVKS